MTQINGIGFTFDTESKSIVFHSVECWNCKGSGKDKRFNLCPNDGRGNKGFIKGKCKHCETTRAANHNRLESFKVTRCAFCDNSSGLKLYNEFDSSVDAGLLADNIELIVLDNSNQGSTFNESYLGLGLIGGVTDYGSYITRSGGNKIELLNIVRDNLRENLARRQFGNFITADNTLIDKAIVRLAVDGYHIYGVGGRWSRVG